MSDDRDHVDEFSEDEEEEDEELEEMDEQEENAQSSNANQIGGDFVVYRRSTMGQCFAKALSHMMAKVRTRLTLHSFLSRACCR